jgi:hypothetical protein
VFAGTARETRSLWCVSGSICCFPAEAAFLEA